LEGEELYIIEDLRDGSHIRDIAIAGLVSSSLIVFISISSLMFFLILFWSGVFLLRKTKDSLSVFSLVFLFNIICIIGIYFVYSTRYGLPYYLGGSDDLYYETMARYFAERFGLFDYGQMHYQVIAPWQHGGYIYLVSLLYRLGSILGGFHTLFPRILNGFLLSLISSMSYSIMSKLGIPFKVAKRSSIILGCMPIMVYISSHTFRDITIIFLLVLLLYYITCEMRSIWDLRKLLITTAIAYISLLYIYESRPVFAPVTILFLLVVLYWKFGFQSEMKSLSTSNLTRLILFAVGAVAFIGFSFQTIAEKFFWYTSTYSDYILSESTGLGRYVFEQPLLPFGLAARLLYLSVYPLPVLSSEVERLLLSLGTAIQIIYLPFLLTGAFQMMKQKLFHIPIAFTLFFVGVASTTFTFRHIVLFYPFAFIMIVYGQETTPEKKATEKKLGMVMSLTFFAVVYLLLKA